MSFDINREILYIRYSPTESTKTDGLEHYAAERPASMEESDFGTLLNFFRIINDETRSDGEHYSNDTLTTNNIHFFCFKSGAAMFKITSCPSMPGSPELYGYFFAADDVRTAWLYSGKLCFVLAADQPKTGKKGKFSEDKLAELDAEAVPGLHETFRTSLTELAKTLAARVCPINFALSCLPEDFYPEGVVVYESGFIPMKTNTKTVDVVLELDDAALAGMINACKEPLRTAVLISTEEDDSDEAPVEVKKSFFGMLKKEKAAPQIKGKQIKRWKYDFLGTGGKQVESCDFIRLNEPIEYSPIGDTFYAYNAIVANDEKDAMYPKPPAARIYVPSSLKPLAPLPLPVPEPEAAPALVPIPETVFEPRPAVPIQSTKPALEPVPPIQLVAPPLPKQALPVTPIPAPKPAEPEPIAVTPPPVPVTPVSVTPPPAPKPAPMEISIEPMRKSGKQRPAPAVSVTANVRPGSVEMPSAPSVDEGEEERGLPTFGRSKTDMSKVESMVPITAKIYGQQMPDPVKMPEPIRMPDPEPVFAKPEPVFAKPEPVFIQPEPEYEPEPEPVFVTPEPEPAYAAPEPEPVPEPVELTPFIHKKPDPEPEFEFEDSGFEPIFEVPNTSKLPPPPAPVTLDTLSTWSSTSAQIIRETDTSGEMDAVALKPKTMNPALELYYKSQQKNNNT